MNEEIKMSSTNPDRRRDDSMKWSFRIRSWFIFAHLHLVARRVVVILMLGLIKFGVIFMPVSQRPTGDVWPIEAEKDEIFLLLL